MPLPDSVAVRDSFHDFAVELQNRHLRPLTYRCGTFQTVKNSRTTPSLISKYRYGYKFMNALNLEYLSGYQEGVRRFVRRYVSDLFKRVFIQSDEMKPGRLASCEKGRMMCLLAHYISVEQLLSLIHI